MADAKRTEQVTLMGLRMFHPNLIVPKKFKNPQGQESGEAKYSGLFGIDPNRPDFVDAKRLAIEVAKAAAYEDDEGNLIPMNQLAWPWVLGDKLADKAKKLVEANTPKVKLAEYYRGLVILKARTLHVPGLAYVQGRQIIEIPNDDEALRKKNSGKFYFGAEVCVDVTFAAHKVGNNTPGVNAYLNSVMATGKGERIGGFTPASERFKGYLGQVSAEDPTVGQDDDEIPF